MSYDLLLRNAHVIDPSQSWDGIADVGIQGNRIAGLGPGLDVAGCPDVRDLSGSHLCPGLIDLHGHWYEAGLYGINPEICLNHGVTTAVDAGTAGFANFPEFRRSVMETSRVDLLGFVHISCLGLHTPFAEELLNLNYAKPVETAMVIDSHRPRAIGVKIRLGAMTGPHGDAALTQALEAARSSTSPLMVHISRGADERSVLERLRPGDILTHCFHGRGNRLIRSDGGLISEVRVARERGLFFDVGHGCGSFSWETAQKAFEHEFYPDTLSTDLHRYSIPEPFQATLPEVMSKFLCLGMSLRDIILKTTWMPSKILGRQDSIGTLRIGSTADVFVFKLCEGEFEFFDTHLKKRRASRRVEPQLTVRNGAPYAAGSVEVALRDLYPCDEVVFQAVRETA